MKQDAQLVDGLDHLHLRPLSRAKRRKSLLHERALPTESTDACNRQTQRTFRQREGRLHAKTFQPLPPPLHVLECRSRSAVLQGELP